MFAVLAWGGHCQGRLDDRELKEDYFAFDQGGLSP